MNFTIKLFPDEHKSFIEILLLKSTQDEFQRLTTGKKILYIETLRKYQIKVENRILSHYNKPRKEFSVSFKPYAAELLVEFLYSGSAHYTDYLQNLARIVNDKLHAQETNTNFYLTQIQKQINAPSIWKK